MHDDDFHIRSFAALYLWGFQIHISDLNISRLIQFSPSINLGKLLIYLTKKNVDFL